MDSKQEKLFLDAREMIIENIDALEVRLGICQTDGLEDEVDHLYNQLSDLYIATKAAASMHELEEVLEQAKAIEESLDSFLSERGYTTVSMEWPEL